jgi:hypothetical protein
MMAAAAKPSWRWDWAGRHGTAWGTTNAMLTATTATWVGRWGTWDPLHLSHQAVVAATVAAGAGGIMWTLLRAARRSGTPDAQHPVTVAYRLACWGGTTTWATLAQLEPHWTAPGAVAYLAALGGAAAVAGGAAALAGDGDPVQVDADPAGTGKAAEERPVSSDPEQAGRDALASEWEQRIQRVCGITVTVPAVEPWPTHTVDGRRVGYTVQANLQAGGRSYRSVAQHDFDLGADLEAGVGCGVHTTMGAHRRIALLEVTEVNVLAEDAPYPADYGPLDINEPLPMMVAADGRIAGPELRQKCMLIGGETGSGKSNTAQVLGAAVARATNALLFDVDCTGGRLSAPLLRPFLEGRARRPAVFWAATDPDEAFLMFRALQRAGIARNNGYLDLMHSADDDKIPVSEAVPQLILRGDEIAHFATSLAADQRLFPLIKSLVYDFRASAIRTLLFTLRGTEECVAQTIQAQSHVIGVLKAQSNAEYQAMFGGGHGLDIADAPYPGCIQIRLDSAGQIDPYHVWRLKPRQLDDIAVAVDGRQPDLDLITAYAMDGRDANGRPFDDLLPGELDCMSTRWDRYWEKFGLTTPVPASATIGAMVAAGSGGTAMSQQQPETPVPTMDQALANLSRAQDALARRVAEVEAERAEADGDGDPGEDGDPVDPGDWAAVMASWEATEGATWRDYAIRIIIRAGDGGIGPRAILDALTAHGVPAPNPDTLHTWLNELLAGDQVHKAGRGRWVAGPQT